MSDVEILEKPQIKVITHNGLFHADECMAIAMLMNTAAKDIEFKIMRTRDRDLIDKSDADYILDVSGTDKSNMNMCKDQWHIDHHFKEQQVIMNNGVIASTAMLVAKNLYSEELFEAMRIEFLDYLSANDNGQDIQGLNDSGISRIVSMHNPTWQERKEFEGSDFETAKFNEAIDICSAYLDRFIMNYIAENDAKEIINDAAEHALFNTLVLPDNTSDIPWKAEVCKYNKKHTKKIRFVVSKHNSGYWNLLTVPTEPNKFDQIVSVPEAWKGKHDQELIDEISNTLSTDECSFDCAKDAVFCHASGFMTRFKTKDAARAVGCGLSNEVDFDRI